MTDAGGLRAADLTRSSHHHHLVCRNCGTVTDVGCAAGHTTSVEPAAAAGFEIGEAEVTFWGLCPACQAPRA
jgi:Fur family ferric uptake transcriptional regulator